MPHGNLSNVATVEETNPPELNGNILIEIQVVLNELRLAVVLLYWNVPKPAESNTKPPTNVVLLRKPVSPDKPVSFAAAL